MTDTDQAMTDLRATVGGRYSVWARVERNDHWGRRPRLVGTGLDLWEAFQIGREYVREGATEVRIELDLD